MDDEKLEREAAKIIFSAPAAASEELAQPEPEGPVVSFVCPFCNEAYNVSKELAGTTIPCRRCRELSRVESKKKKKRSIFCLRSFGIGVAAGVALSLVAMLLLKILHLL